MIVRRISQTPDRMLPRVQSHVPLLFISTSASMMALPLLRQRQIPMYVSHDRP